MSVDKITITKAGASYAAQLTSLSITTFCETFGAVNKQEDMDQYIADEMTVVKLTEELNDTDNLFILAWYDESLAGYMKLRTSKIPVELADNNPLELERVYVRHEYHSKKIGAALMSYCIQYATGKGYETVWLGVWEHNHKAIRFYEKWGFELFGEHAFILGTDTQRDVLMKKLL